MRRLWAGGRFADIQVEAVDTAQGLVLAFKLVEKRRYFLRRVEFAPERFQREITLKPGEEFDQVTTRKFAAELRRKLVEEGYPAAEVQASLIPVNASRADLRVNVRSGSHYRIRDVQFSGTSGLPEAKLREALQASRVKRMVPGIPGLWKGWRSHPAFSEHGVAADLARIRALYISEGYLSPDVALARNEFSGKNADLTIEAHSGPRYRVAEIHFASERSEPPLNVPANPDRPFPHAELCRCLRELKRGAESEGRLDFDVDLQIQRRGEPELPAARGKVPEPSLARNLPPVSLLARVTTGRPFRVGRMEFQSAGSINDLTLRRAMTIDEADPFDWGQIHRSVARLNRLGLIEPVSEENLRVLRRPDEDMADLFVSVKCAQRGRWSLSGPAGPFNVLNNLNFTLSSRLPNWGKKPWEIGTYYLSVSFLSFPQALIRADSIDISKKILPLFAVSRPYLPGQGWRSGFFVSPQLNWRESLKNYGITQLRELGHGVLSAPQEADIVVPVSWAGPAEQNGRFLPSATGAIICEQPKPRWRLARTAAKLALDWLPLLLL